MCNASLQHGLTTHGTTKINATYRHCIIHAKGVNIGSSYISFQGPCNPICKVLRFVKLCLSVCIVYQPPTFHKKSFALHNTKLHTRLRLALFHCAAPTGLHHFFQAQALTGSTTAVPAAHLDAQHDCTSATAPPPP